MAKGNADEALAARLRELAKRAQAGSPMFSCFLSPAQMNLALHAAKAEGIGIVAFGGIPDAERQVVAFCEEAVADFPVAYVQASYNSRYGAPGHRDLLGAVLGLGVDRSHVGDILVEAGCAYIIASTGMARFIADNLTAAGRIPLECLMLAELPEVGPPRGEEKRDTVASMRLDAVLAAALCLSRGEVAELVTQGLVQVNHLQAMRTDYGLKAGDVLSVRGVGRVVVHAVGLPTRKGRLPVTFECFGLKRR